jgi:hypothetical protein
VAFELVSPPLPSLPSLASLLKFGQRAEIRKGARTRGTVMKIRMEIGQMVRER